MKKITFISFIKEAIDPQPTNNSSSASDMEPEELRRLSNMDPARREHELANRKRKEKQLVSPRLRTLLQQKDNIEQQIAIERAKEKQGTP